MGEDRSCSVQRSAPRADHRILQPETEHVQDITDERRMRQPTDHLAKTVAALRLFLLFVPEADSALDAVNIQPLGESAALLMTAGGGFFGMILFQRFFSHFL